MPLTRVTITGADDHVELDALGRLHERYPFVEWGILVGSPDREGTPRYPSGDWLMGLLRWSDRQRRRRVSDLPHVALSLHLCGKPARDAMEHGDLSYGRSFGRIQINGFRPTAALVGFAIAHRPTRIICQARDDEQLQAAAEFSRTLRPNWADVLWDPSGGRGISHSRWPTAPAGVWLGYAGGINPENVRAVLDAIEATRASSPSDYWIDMESGVRDEHDRFDLARVEAVLEACASRILVWGP